MHAAAAAALATTANALIWLCMIIQSIRYVILTSGLHALAVAGWLYYINFNTKSRLVSLYNTTIPSSSGTIIHLDINVVLVPDEGRRFPKLGFGIASQPLIIDLV